MVKYRHLNAYICIEVIVLEENKNYITYDENWQSVSESEYPVMREPTEVYSEKEYDNEVSKPRKRKLGAPKQLLITIQLILCVIIALAAFVLKSIGGEIYEMSRDWYYTQLNNSAIFDGKNSFEIDSLFGRATADEV